MHIKHVVKQNILAFIGAMLMAFSCWAEEVQLTPDHPDTYVVKKGDTLWDISGKFLQKPWLWPEIWHANPDIANPNLIYPGDVLNLVYVNGKPQLTLQRGDAGNTVKMSPSCPEGKLCPAVRVEPLEEAIPAIPLDIIDPFLTGSRVVSDGVLDSAPYVLMGSQKHVVTGAGDLVYARGAFDKEALVYNIFRRGKVYVDKETDEVLGIQAIDIGTAKIKSSDADVGQLVIVRNTQEIRINDRLLPTEERKIQSIFNPSSPDSEIRGTILDVEGGVNQIGPMNVVLIDKGERDGLKVGNVLAIYQHGEHVRDPNTGEVVKLIDERAGLMMIFNVFEKTSYGLVLESDRPLAVEDHVRNP